ncbi:hypothetical protein KR093_009662, partial [Drosophila rubida]
MCKFAFAAVCLLAALGAVSLEVRASPASSLELSNTNEDRGKSKIGNWQLDSAVLTLTCIADDILHRFHEMCRNVSGSDTSVVSYVSLKDILHENSTARQQFEELVLNDEPGPKLAKHCKSWEKVVADNFADYDKVKHCLTLEKQRLILMEMRLIGSMIKFVCSRDLLVLINEGGLQCLDTKDRSLTNCTNYSFHTDITDITNIMVRFKLISPKYCANWQNLETCVMRQIEHCMSNTRVRSTFGMLKDASDC